MQTGDPIENIVIHSHEEAEAAILLGKSYELRKLLAEHNLPVDEVMPDSKAKELDRVLLNGQACFALGHELPNLQYLRAFQYLTQLRALPHDKAKESLCNLATVAAMDIKGVSRIEFAFWYNERAQRLRY